MYTFSSAGQQAPNASWQPPSLPVERMQCHIVGRPTSAVAASVLPSAPSCAAGPHTICQFRRNVHGQQRRLAIVQATPQPVANLPVVPLPESEEAAINAAVEALVPSIKPHLAAAKNVKTAKGFSSSKPSGAQPRYGVEIPVADSSPQGAVALASKVLDATAAALRGAGVNVNAAQWTVVHARETALALDRPSKAAGRNVMGLRAACQQAHIGGLLVVVEPGVSDIALVEQLLDEVWQGSAALILNPEWGQQDKPVPAEYSGLLASINVVYSFLPCAIQGLLGSKEGAVLRVVQGGSAKGAQWKILYQMNNQYVQVGAMARRPTSDDLQLAFMNASAATGPLASTARFFKGLTNKGKK